MSKNKLGWKVAWMKHRQEFLPWLAGIVVYMAFMWGEEVTKYSLIVLCVTIFAPPLIIIRMIVTATREK